MRIAIPFTRQALIEAEIDGAQRGRMPAGHQACSGPIQGAALPDAASATDPQPRSTDSDSANPLDHHGRADETTQSSREASRSAGAAAAAQLLQLPLESVRFLQAMAEDGVAARPVRIGANPPAGHVLFRSLSD